MPPVFIMACVNLNKIFETFHRNLCKYFGFSCLFLDKIFLAIARVFIMREKEKEDCYKRLNIGGRITLGLL